MAKLNLGKMPCETCQNSVTVKQNENGTLSYRCDECDGAPYAKTGTQQNELWRVKLTPLASAPSDLKPTSKEITPAIKPAEIQKLDMWWGNAL